MTCDYQPQLKVNSRISVAALSYATSIAAVAFLIIGGDPPEMTSEEGVSGLPAEDGLAGGGDFVEAADTSGVRGGLDELGIFFGFLGDGAHGLNE